MRCSCASAPVYGLLPGKRKSSIVWRVKQSLSRRQGRCHRGQRRLAHDARRLVRVSSRLVGRRHAAAGRRLGGLRFPCALGRSGLPGAQARRRWCDADRALAHAAGPLPRGPRAPPAHAPAGAADAARATAGATRPATATTTGRCAIPTRRARSGCGARTALYDIVVVLGHNDRPRVRGRGSAIFMHVAQARIRAHRGLHRARARAPAAAAGAAGAAADVRVRPRNKKRPELSLRASESTYRGSGVLEAAARLRWSAGLAAKRLSSCRRARRDRRGRGPRAPGRARPQADDDLHDHEGCSVPTPDHTA